MIFFDSHGSAHETCPADHPEAADFGPQWTSRRLSETELEALGLDGQSTPWAAAVSQGRIITLFGEWDCLEGT